MSSPGKNYFEVFTSFGHTVYLNANSLVQGDVITGCLRHIHTKRQQSFFLMPGGEVIFEQPDILWKSFKNQVNRLLKCLPDWIRVKAHEHMRNLR